MVRKFCQGVQQWTFRARQALSGCFDGCVSHFHCFKKQFLERTRFPSLNKDGSNGCAKGGGQVWSFCCSRFVCVRQAVRHPRLWRLLHSCKREGRKKGSGRFLKKLWNLFLTDRWNWILVVHQVPPECTNEMLRTCLDDPEVFQFLFRAAEDCASASMPETIRRAFMSASMTALQKPDGGVRGIATGTSVRRLVARTPVWESGGSNLRSLPLCIVHASWRRTLNPGSHRREPHVHGAVHRWQQTTMCTEAPCWQSCTRFPVCKGCFRSSELPVPTPRVTFGKMRLVQHRIIQAEGGEQGDPLFSLAIHDPV